MDRKYEVTEAMLLRADIPSAYWNSQVDDLEDLALKEKMTLVLRDVNSMISSNFGCMIAGPMRTGKTVFACVILRVAMSYGAIVHYVRSCEITTLWRKAWSPKLNPGLTSRSGF